MGLKHLKRTQKTKILATLLTGETKALANINRNRSTDLSTWSDQELEAEHERLRQKRYRETGVLGPPLPDYKAMSDEELKARIAKLKQAKINQ